MPRSSPPAEAVVPILLREDRVLVIKRSDRVVMPGYWCPPSGGIEEGETQEQAAVRETAEELGVAVKPVAKVWECPTDDGSYTLHWWLVTGDSYDLRPDPREVAETRWVTPDEFLALDPTFVGDREFFAEVLPRLRDGRVGNAGLTSLGKSGQYAGHAHDEETKGKLDRDSAAE